MKQKVAACHTEAFKWHEKACTCAYYLALEIVNR